MDDVFNKQISSYSLSKQVDLIIDRPDWVMGDDLSEVSVLLDSLT